MNYKPSKSADSDPQEGEAAEAAAAAAEQRHQVSNEPLSSMRRG